MIKCLLGLHNPKIQIFLGEHVEVFSLCKDCGKNLQNITDVKIETPNGELESIDFLKNTK